MSVEDSEKKDLTNKPGQTEEEEGIPEKWKSLPLADMVDKGWRPRVRTVRGTEYMSLRMGQHDKSLGVHTEKKWNLLMEMFPRLKKTQEFIAQEKKTKKKAGLLGIPIKKDKSIPKSYIPNIITIRYYEILVDKGFDGDFNDFINEVIETHFMKCHGITLPILYKEPMLVNR